MNRSTLLGLVLLSFLAGCVSNPAIRVADAEGVESVSAISMGCGKPFKLTRDCSGFSGPTKKIVLSGHEIKVAGNEDQTLVVLFGGKLMSGISQATNLGFELVKRELAQRNIKILTVTPIESSGQMHGYAIVTDVPNYQVWDEFKK